MTLGMRETVVRLEREMWEALDLVASREGLGFGAILGQIDAARPGEANLACAARVFLAAYFAAALLPEGEEGRGPRPEA